MFRFKEFLKKTPGSRPPPLPALVPDHQSNYYDDAFPRPVEGGFDPAALFPPVPAAPVEPTIARAPQYSPDYTAYEIHTAVSVDETRESREREVKPLTNKEKKRLELGQREIWRYVAARLMEDPVFLRRRKKRADSEDKEDLKVCLFFIFNLIKYVDFLCVLTLLQLQRAIKESQFLTLTKLIIKIDL